MAGTIVVDRIESDGSYASTINVASKVNFTGGMQIGGQDTTFAGMRNRIINGAMTIDQRNDGASIATTSSGVYFVDRWRNSIDSSANVSFQQSTDAPTGFKNSLSCTIVTANTPVSATTYSVLQPIEGQNIVDFNQGTANATPMTLSFWVKSSITGTYSIALRNSAGAKTCVKNYTINQSNTWEYKTLTFPPDTTGTWYNDNQAGCFINFALGAGSSVHAPSTDVWHTGAYTAVSGTVNLIATQGAVFKFTGVQFEKGSSATPFEYRQYGAELALCHRYCWVLAGNGLYYPRQHVDAISSTTGIWYVTYPVTFRALPSLTTKNVSSSTIEMSNHTNGAAPALTSVTFGESAYQSGFVNMNAASGFTAGSNGHWRWIGGPDANFTFSAEL